MLKYTTRMKGYIKFDPIRFKFGFQSFDIHAVTLGVVKIVLKILKCIFPCLCRPFPYLVCIFKAVCKQTPSCRSGNDLVAIEPGFDLSVIVERFLFGTTTYYFRSRERIVYTYTKNVRF